MVRREDATGEDRQQPEVVAVGVGGVVVHQLALTVVLAVLLRIVTGLVFSHSRPSWGWRVVVPRLVRWSPPQGDFTTLVPWTLVTARLLKGELVRT